LRDLKKLYWIGSSLDDLKRFPQAVRQIAGYGLYLAQQGDKHPDAKPLRGFAGTGTLEVVVDRQGDTYRAVYTVSFEEVVYVLHAFQKKSKRGIATPKREIEQIKNRLRRATEHYRMLKGPNND
jgi:phage-related protein